MFIRNSDDTWSREIHDTRRAQRREIKTIRPASVREVVGQYAMFSLAPLYVHAGIAYSIPDQFELEAGIQDRVIIDYRKTVISGVYNWGRYVEAINLEAWDAFAGYVSTLGFYSANKNLVWFTHSRIIDVEDIGEDLILTSSALPARVQVFLPVGNKGKLNIVPGLPAKLVWDTAPSHIVDCAQKILTSRGRIDRAF